MVSAAVGGVLVVVVVPALSFLAWWILEHTMMSDRPPDRGTSLANGTVLMSSMPEHALCSFTLANPTGDDVAAKVRIHSETCCFFYVRAHDQATVRMTAGVYRVKMTTGRDWDTNNGLFRRRARFSETDQPMDLITYRHVTLRLQHSLQGDVRTRSIAPSDF